MYVYKVNKTLSVYHKEVKTKLSRYKKETDKAIRELSKHLWNLQDQTNKIKEAVLTGEKGNLKMPEKRELEPGEPIPYDGTVDVDSIFPKEPCEQVEVEFTVKETLQMYTHYVDSLSTDTHVLAFISIVSLIIAIVALIV